MIIMVLSFKFTKRHALYSLAIFFYFFLFLQCLDWIGYEATSPTAPKLPSYLRGFVIGECPLPIQNPHIGVWLPDYASQALCTGDKLISLPEFSKLRILPPLLYLANACPPTPDEAVEIAVDIIFLLLIKNARLDQIQVLLDDKGPWKTVQMLKVSSKLLSYF
jgi:hypothetical protein